MPGLGLTESDGKLTNLAGDISFANEGELHGQNPSQSKKIGPTIPTESPLKRPIESRPTPEPVEKPLERPIDGSEEILYCDTVATFAVDTSGSTAGKVLDEEKEVIKTLCSGLSRDAYSQATIIPWNHDVQGLNRADELEALFSDGGTRPSKLNASTIARMALSKCSAWFLLTDGQIDRQEINDFSRGTCDAGLHGTPCVVILFGYRSARPSLCNISVGLAVFSNAADCLFLFHDLDSTQVYILQSKGVFNDLLPSGCDQPILDTKTLWSDLPLFQYRQLFDLPLPIREELLPHELLLQGKHKIDLQDLYQNKVDSSTAGEILSNNDNLQSVVLAAQLRGDDENIRRWVSKQKVQAKNVLNCERPDVLHQAAAAMRDLLSLLADSNLDRRLLNNLRQNLRTAHHTNWAEFVSNINAEHKEESARSVIVSDVMYRISSNRKEMDSGVNSPRMLSPVSPGSFYQPSASDRNPFCWQQSSSSQSGYVFEGIHLPLAPRPKHRILSGGTMAATVPSQHDSKRSIRGRPSHSDLLTTKSLLKEDNAGVLYIEQYKYRPGPSNDGFERTCPVCEEEDVLLVFLLKSPPTDISTPKFPQPNARKGLTYPLAMGTYPETDILSSQICCDSCAYVMINGKMEYSGDQVIGAIPIMQEAFSGRFESTTLDLIDNALQKRFQKSSIDLVFLSIVYSTLTEVDDKSSDLQPEALKTACSWIVRKTCLPSCLSSSIASSTPTTSGSSAPRPMIPVLEENIKNVQQPEPPLLQYPVGGFVVLMLIITDFTRVGSLKTFQLTVWHRFLFHLVEKHCALLAADQSRAVLALQNILSQSSTSPNPGHGNDLNTKHSPKTESEPGSPGQHRPLTSTQLDTICGSHLLSEEDLDEFQRLENLFEPVKDLCSVALHRFLMYLLKEVTTPSLAIDIFDTMRAKENLDDIFHSPTPTFSAGRGEKRVVSTNVQ